MFQITIDGPTGSGKTSVAKKVAEMLNILYFDADLLTSVIALKCVENGVNPTIDDDVDGVLKKYSFDLINRDNRIFATVNGAITMHNLNNMLVVRSQYSIAKLPCIRKFIAKKQQEIATKYTVIIDGFNTAEEIFPNAKFKFFFNADLDVRAKRKYDGLISKGVDITLDQVTNDILDVDRSSFVGETSKLSIGEDSHIIDTTYNTPTETAEIICDIIRKSGAI